MSKDYYSILGVDKKASKDDIKKAFRKLAHKYHPDKGGGDPAKFNEVNEAYSILSDDKKRAEYDTYGRTFSGAGGQGGSGFEGFDFSQFAREGGFQDFDLGDIFGDFFGGGRDRTPRGRDISIDLELSFKESVFGVNRTVLLNKTSECATCHGSGAEPGTDMETCTVCNGKGSVKEVRQSFFGSLAVEQRCSQCKGTGKVPKEKCHTCKGIGIEKKQEEISIDIPAGVENGEMVRLSGAGEAVSGGKPGDLYVKLHVAKDHTFTKQGTDIFMSLNVKLSDALLGTDYTIPTVDEQPVTIKIPQGVSHGEILRVKGKGVPTGKNNRGDMMVKVKIELPQKLSKKAKGLIEELREEGI
ncbi:MAG: molecular chaperone DnaJ [Candidatus Zambryskibacteria bacterium CG10_big_fil_rev_8_21_14_0_10_42_12]|uniref:Chaperone protein DnaJ n=1 Tax=Candidatus Zambryskibacteria bacterium CG10_big_fil_rev_8_21_14_0_10_42_12 TaxID=1975115 RepID=A0A2H0QX41_9BACT|nr:MAG: molecular chaperone DnaJ [Candidatus Zambryskibacteria bacterium CG10_big_fil_rev_8_21_14_0_10_42_12]